MSNACAAIGHRAKIFQAIGALWKTLQLLLKKVYCSSLMTCLIMLVIRTMISAVCHISMALAGQGRTGQIGMFQAFYAVKAEASNRPCYVQV